MSYLAGTRKAERKRAWRSENLAESRKRARAYSRRYRENNTPKCRARYEVRKALRNGTLEKQPCAICGNPIAEAHHEDYGKPLDVQWLCYGCHDDVHAGRLSILFIKAQGDLEVGKIRFAQRYNETQRICRNPYAGSCRGTYQAGGGT